MCINVCVHDIGSIVIYCTTVYKLIHIIVCIYRIAGKFGEFLIWWFGGF